MTGDLTVDMDDRRMVIELMDGRVGEGSDVDHRPSSVGRLIEESQALALTDDQSRAACSWTALMAWRYGMGP